MSDSLEVLRFLASSPNYCPREVCKGMANECSLPIVGGTVTKAPGVAKKYEVYLSINRSTAVVIQSGGSRRVLYR